MRRVAGPILYLEKIFGLIVAIVERAVKNPSGCDRWAGGVAPCHNSFPALSTAREAKRRVADINSYITRPNKYIYEPIRGGCNRIKGKRARLCGAGGITILPPPLTRAASH